MTGILERPLRSVILAAADSPKIQRFVRKYGMQLGARRFVAGESVDDFLAVAREVNGRGFAVACGILGEAVRSRKEATDASGQYCALLQRFAAERIDANVAFKLTHVGLDIDPQLAFENAARIAQTAQATGNSMRLDMERSRYVDATLDIYRRLRQGFRCVGFVLQSYLYRSADDLRDVLELSPNVRLVKGAYLEPPSVAFAQKGQVDDNYRRLLEMALTADGYTAIATHDPKLIAYAREVAVQNHLPLRGRYEFQMLYGINEALGRSLVALGYRVRLAVPYGNYWFPYLMRRLAERPANLAFFLKGALSKR